MANSESEPLNLINFHIHDRTVFVTKLIFETLSR
jgi:hypothetical protein